MKRKTEIEATLDRSLRSQVRLPKLDSRFDTAVWARIEAEESRSAPARAPAAAPVGAGWLRIVNALGIGGLAIFGIFFAAQMLSGADVTMSMPEFSAEAIDRFAMTTSMGIAATSLIFGLLFTPWGRRLRDELI